MGRPGAEQSQRQLRVGEAVRHVLAGLLLRGVLHDPLLAQAHLTVSEVRVSRDLKHAMVFVTELGGELRPELLAALDRAAPFLRGELARQIHLKYAPELRFRRDASFAEANRIDTILNAARGAAGPSSEDDHGPN